MEDLADVVPAASSDAAAPRTMAEQAAVALRELITRGELKPGSQLREGPLTDTLGVSRNTLREAFRLLDRERLVVHRLHRGVEVRSLSADDVRDIYAVRRSLEQAALASAAAAPLPDVIEGMHEAIAAARVAAGRGDWQAVATWDLTFHRRLVGQLASERIDDLFRSILAELRLAFAMIEDQAGFLRPFVAWNDRLVELLERSQLAACAQELGDYLAHSEQQVTAALG
jgi:DNA-binding GntR family transcriptional regulator